MTEGLLFDVRRYSVHDGPGIRTTVFFKGCPLRCVWCHNPESQKMDIETVAKEKHLDSIIYNLKEPIGYLADMEHIMETIEKDRLFYEESGGGVTFSGGEPLMQPEFLKVLASECKNKGIHTTLDTSGYAPAKNVMELFPFIDLFLFDLKALDDSDHKIFTGSSNKQILQNLSLLADREVIIRFPVVPGMNDNDDQLLDMMVFLSKIPLKRKEIHLLPYHRIQQSKYKRLCMEYTMHETQEPSKAHLEHIKTLFQSIGFQVQLGG